MINRAHRFHGYNSLRNVYQHGQQTRGGLISLRYQLNPRRRTFRLAVVVSRKVHKSAVVRNRIRRRVYSMAGAQLSELSQPYDLVFTVFSDQVASLAAIELSEQIAELFKRAGLINSLDRGNHGIVVGKEEKHVHDDHSTADL